MELPAGLPLAQDLLGERPLSFFGLTARQRYGRLRGENDTRDEWIARENMEFKSLETGESGSPDSLFQMPSHSSSLVRGEVVT